MNIHLRTAVSTVHQPSQQMDLTPSVRISPDITADLLDQIEGELVDDRLLRVLEDHPVILRNIMALLILEVLRGLEVDRMAQIFRFPENAYNGRRGPVIRIFEGLALVQALPEPRHMNGGNLDLIILQDLGDLVWAVSFDSQSKYPANHFGSFLVHNPVIAVLFIFEIAIGTSACDVFAGVALGPEYGLDLLGRIPCVPLIHDVAERSEIIVTLDGIYTVIDGDQTDTFLPEHLHDLTDLQIVAAHSAHVLNANYADVSFIDLIHHFHEARTVKAGAGDPVVREMHWTWQVIGFCEVHKHSFLIADAVRFALKLVVPGQTFIQGCDVAFLHSNVLLSLYVKTSKIGPTRTFLSPVLSLLLEVITPAASLYFLYCLKAK